MKELKNDFNIGDKLKRYNPYVNEFGEEQDNIYIVTDIIYQLSVDEWLYELYWRNDSIDCGTITEFVDLSNSLFYKIEEEIIN